MDFAVAVRHRPAELGHAHGHGAAVPVLDDAAGAEPERVFGIGFFRVALEGAEPDLRAAVLGGGVIEIDALALFHERILAFDEAIARFLVGSVRLLDDRPAHAGGFDEFVVGRDMFVFQMGERAVFLVKHAVRVDVVEMGIVPDGHFVSGVVLEGEDEFPVLVLHAGMAEFEQAVGDGESHPNILTCLAGRFHHLEPLLRPALGVAIRAVFLDPHRGGKNQIRDLGGGGGIDVGNDEELVFEAGFRGVEFLEVWQRLARVGHLDHDGVNVAALVLGRAEFLEQQHGVIADGFLDASGLEDKFLIVSDVYPTASTEIADLILPAAMWVEKNGAYGNSERRTQQWFKMVEPPGQAREDVWMTLAIAHRLFELGHPGMKDKDGKFIFTFKDDAGNEVPVWDYAHFHDINADRVLYEEYRPLTHLKHKHVAPYDELVKATGMRWPVVEQSDGSYKETRYRFVEGEDPFVEKGKGIDFYHSTTENGRAQIWFCPFERHPEEPDAEYPFWLWPPPRRRTLAQRHHDHARPSAQRCDAEQLLRSPPG